MLDAARVEESEEEGTERVRDDDEGQETDGVDPERRSELETEATKDRFSVALRLRAVELTPAELKTCDPVETVEVLLDGREN
jgi:hypothetical protein